MQWLRTVGIGLVLTAFTTTANAQRGTDRANEARRWMEDLEVFATELPKRHLNAFHTMSRPSFDSAVANLRQRIPQLARHQIIVEFARIVAMVGDGHTNIYPTRDTVIAFHTLPITLYQFKDGLYIRAAHESRRELLGARVVAIGGVPADSAYARVRAMVGRDNEQGARYFVPILLGMTEVLHAFGLSNDSARATFVLEQGGGQRHVELAAFARAGPSPGDTDAGFDKRPGWVDARDGSPTPLWLSQEKRDGAWLRFLPEYGIVYAQVNAIRNGPQETLAQFAERLRAEVQQNGARRLVVDLRFNRGGNGELMRSLVRNIIKADVIDRPGGLYVIIGRSTWSAAQFLVDALEKYSSPVFVGEPTGSRGNHFGDSRVFTLPNSRVSVRTSVFYWQDWHPLDRRPWTAPHLPAELTFEDYRMGRDPAMAAILSDTARTTPPRPVGGS